jgi:hypothetical protein
MEMHKCVLPSITKKKLAVTLVSSTEAFSTMRFVLQVEVSTAAANILGPKMGEECWNSGLDVRLEAVVVSIQLEAVTTMLKSAQLREIRLGFPQLTRFVPRPRSHVRPTQTEDDGKWSMPDPLICCGFGFCKLRSLILLATKSRDPKTNLEPGRNLVADLNVIDLT